MSKLNFFDYTMGHARLAILRSLTEAVLHTANDSILAQLMETHGLPVTRDQVRSQLCWLEEQGLVRLSRPNDHLIVVTLRERGADVAVGRSSIDGVQKPAPGR